MKDKKPILSITNKGIEMNLGKGDSLTTHAERTFMQGVKQNVVGGELGHFATNELTQISNTMEATDEGRITNEVREGRLNQLNNQMRASAGGTIENTSMSTKKDDLHNPIAATHPVQSGTVFVNLQGHKNIVRDNTFQNSVVTNNGNRKNWFGWIFIGLIVVAVCFALWKVGFPISFNISDIYL